MGIARNYCTVPDNFYPAKSFQKYTSMGIVRKYRKGETIVMPGEVMQSVIYVLSGKVSLYLLEEKKQKLLYYARRYCIIDQLFSCTTSIFNSAYVHIVAEENSTVCIFSEESLFRICKQDDDAHRELLRTYTSKCGFFMYAFKEMDLYNPTARILRFINELCSTRGKQVNHTYEINIKITQRTISEITGVHQFVKFLGG